MNDDVLDTFAALLAELAARRHRALLWIAAPAADAVARGLMLWRAQAWQAPLWLGPACAATDVTALPAAKARTRLGGEHDLVVVDAASPDAGFDPEAFGAVSGTVRAGGVLVLLTPGTWQTASPSPDADYARLAAWPHVPADLHGDYLTRLARRLLASPLALRWPVGAPLPEWPLPSMTASGTSPSDDRDCLSSDQATAVSRLTRLRRRRPLVISADRGRGKSAALGIAAARRLLAGERCLWVTAPRSAAVEPLFERLAALLPQGRHETQTFQVTLDGELAEVRFVAPDAVLDALRGEGIDVHSPPTLFVDEAAAIPAPLLGRWLEAFPRIAYASTVHGYEGTGRGFALRFQARLDRDTPDWRACHLSQPVRWADGDPLEALTRELLLLDAEPADDARVAQALTDAPLRLVMLDRQALSRDERGLGELFGLLVQAHYRTTPADLRQLLDAPDVRLLAAYAGEVCLGVCLAQDEGGFPPHLALAIQCGKRRPRGHLLAQSLAMHAGHRWAAEARWCRIQRIAVHPAARRRGVGSALVAALADQLLDAGIERMGTSFGAETSLLDFWRAQHFQSLRLGLSREASSGEHALMMGRALCDAATPSLQDLAQDFQRLLPSLLAFEETRLDAGLAAALLREGKAPALSEQTLARVEWFAAGGGELALVRPWLAEAWLAWWRAGSPATADDELRCLVVPLFQGEPAGDARQAGRKARLAHWRALAGRLHRQCAR